MSRTLLLGSAIDGDLPCPYLDLTFSSPIFHPITTLVINIIISSERERERKGDHDLSIERGRGRGGGKREIFFKDFSAGENGKIEKRGPGANF